MGVKGFLAFLRQHVPATVSDLKVPQEFDHVYLDMNALLHRASQKAHTKDDFVMKLFAALDRAIKVAIPRQSLFLAVDGPAPAAKLLEQRRRRLARLSEEKTAASGISSLDLTPGTAFMSSELDSILHYWALSRLQNRQKHNVRLIVSGANVEGEGELKARAPFPVWTTFFHPP